jgi:hypothetical protein
LIFAESELRDLLPPVALLIRSQLAPIRRGHTLASRSIGSKIEPLLHQTPKMIQELFFLLSQKNIPSLKFSKSKFQEI